MARKRRPTINSDQPVVTVKLGALTPHPENPRTIDPDRLEALKRALEASPEMLRARPVIALTDGRVIAGNQRLTAARELGWKEIPAVYVDLDENTAKVWALRDNQPYGEWDPDGLADWLRTLTAAGADMELTGFAYNDIDQLLAGTAGDVLPTPEDPGGYQEQYGVVVICESERHQATVYDELVAHGYTLKVVTT